MEGEIDGLTSLEELRERRQRKKYLDDLVAAIIIIISYLYRLNLFSNNVLLSIKDLFKTYINYKRKIGIYNKIKC